MENNKVYNVNDEYDKVKDEKQENDVQLTRNAINIRLTPDIE